MTILCRDLSLLSSKSVFNAPVVATIGVFDGLHRGHQKLFQRVASLSQQGPKKGCSCVISFYPHPDGVLGKSPQVPLLSTIHQRLRVLSEIGIDLLFLMHFTPQLAQTRAAEFLERKLISELQVSHLVLGPDAHVGFRREGSPEYMLRFFQERNRQAEILPFLELEGATVSAQRIRKLLAEGQIETANNLLGRNYRLEGKVVRGFGRGRTINIPTANLGNVFQQLPHSGVYATRIHRKSGIFPSVTNIGVRPTFDGQHTSIESHLIEYQAADFYGEQVEFEFISRIRSEQRFDSVQLLKAQIVKDIERAKDILKF